MSPKVTQQYFQRQRGFGSTYILHKKNSLQIKLKKKKKYIYIYIYNVKGPVTWKWKSWVWMLGWPLNCWSSASSLWHVTFSQTIHEEVAGKVRLPWCYLGTLTESCCVCVCVCVWKKVASYRVPCEFRDVINVYSPCYKLQYIHISLLELYSWGINMNTNSDSMTPILILIPWVVKLRVVFFFSPVYATWWQDNNV